MAGRGLQRACHEAPPGIGHAVLGPMLSRSPPRAVALAALLVAASACGPTPEPAPAPGLPPFSEPPRCASDAGASAGATRKILVGSGDGADFVAYVEGQDVSLVLGYQGGYMITPTVRIPIVSGDGVEACWQARLENALVEGGDVVPGLLSHVFFERSGDALEAGPFNDLLGGAPGPLQNKTLVLTVTVTGLTFEATETRHLRLR